MAQRASRVSCPHAPVSPWLHRYAWLVAGATFLLIVAGASVTSNRAGLAVPDWPETYGYSMWRFPLSKMVGGIFYEHGHRLLASFVGLLTTGLALWTFFGQKRALVRRLGLAALAVVLAQGLLGGLTVLWYLPPPISIAHAALAEAFFCLTLAMVVVTGRRWDDFEPAATRTRWLRGLTLTTTALIYLQIILGAAVRHAERATIVHVLGAIVVFIVAGTTIMAVLPTLQRRDTAGLAIGLGLLLFAQIWAGVLTLMFRVPKAAHGQLEPFQIWLPTLHLALGAAILGTSFVLTLKVWRLTRNASEPHPIPWPAVLELTKPRIVSMVLVTTALGFFLGSGDRWDWSSFLLTLTGVGLASGGAAVLNNYLERDTDALMQRTRHRALPAGLMDPQHALGLGVSLALAGVLLLARGVNLLTAFLVLLAVFLYVVVYTPLKKLTWLNTTFGAIPGAIPPLAGWAAASGALDNGAWLLFAILFAWQHPHFFAIGWMYRDDYRAAGLQMLPAIERDGRRTFRHTIFFAALLLIVSLMPSVWGITGRLYVTGALILGALMLAMAVAFRLRPTFAEARRLLQTSVLYLPALLLLILADAGM
ncbi:MAG: heme o synthase [Verrucomicrobiae bacterium]|nr:heme o synthase [Verrucomicrobiae bacterium]